MAEQGREVVLRMLRDTGAAISRDPDVALLVDLLAACGYSATAAPLEELAAADAGGAGPAAAVTPLLPDLYVRTRRLDAAGEAEEGLERPRVAVQVIRAEDVLRCAALRCFRFVTICVTKPPLSIWRMATWPGMYMHATFYGELDCSLSCERM